MPFTASNSLTEADTAKTIAAGGMNVHYHDERHLSNAIDSNRNGL